jgi:hypothetical protein
MFKTILNLLTIEHIEKFEGGLTLIDGTEIYAKGNLTEGVLVQIMVDGEMKDLPNGTYELQDGRSITIEAGKITAVIEKPVEETPAEVVVEQASIQEPIEASIQEPIVEPIITNTEVVEETKPIEETSIKEPIEPIVEVKETIPNGFDERIKKIEDSIANLVSSNTNLKLEKEKFEKDFNDLKTFLETKSNVEPSKKNYVQEENLNPLVVQVRANREVKKRN